MCSLVVGRRLGRRALARIRVVRRRNRRCACHQELNEMQLFLLLSPPSTIDRYLSYAGLHVWVLNMAALVPMPWRQRKRILGPGCQRQRSKRDEALEPLRRPSETTYPATTAYKVETSSLWSSFTYGLTPESRAIRIANSRGQALQTRLADQPCSFTCCGLMHTLISTE